jgi:Uma2 family endonuclease
MAIVLSPPEQRIILRGVSWETYEHLLADHVSSSAPRFTYDRGMLEIMSPSPEHERLNRSIALLVETLAEELKIDVDDLGSTTVKREDLERGFEPDSCFYVQNAERVKNRDRIDLVIDPPPDLVIEIDITSPSLDKFPIFAQLGVPEIWHYDGQRLKILKLQGGKYMETESSTALPHITSQILLQFIDDSRLLRRTAWLQRVREWARTR